MQSFILNLFPEHLMLFPVTVSLGKQDVLIVTFQFQEDEFHVDKTD